MQFITSEQKAAQATKLVSFLDNLRFADKPQIDVLLETSYSKEIRICMQQYNVMKEHTAPKAITIMLISGNVLISSPIGDVDLKAGEMVCFDALMPHSLAAKQDSVIRLTLSKQDSVERVESVI